MSYQPIVPLSGNAGWAFLRRTRPAQQETFNRSGEVKRNAEHFRKEFHRTRDAEALVNDRQLLKVAIGAFGLDEDINNKYFIRKVLESDTNDRNSLANRLSDKRYLEMAEAFGFGIEKEVAPTETTFVEKTITAYQNRQFEIAVGNTAPAMRLILGLERDLTNIAERSISDDAKWFTVMATPPVRKIFETALGMPDSIGALDIDRQLKEFRERSDSVFGKSEVTGFNDPEALSELTQRFLLRDQVQNFTESFSPQSTALQILQFNR